MKIIENVEFKIGKLLIIFRSKEGFTLFELLITIVIVGVLSSFFVINYRDAQTRARDYERKSNIKQLQVALQMYFQNVGYYPYIVARGTGKAFSDQTDSWDELYASIGPYMQKRVVDPVNGGTLPLEWYVYGYVPLNGPPVTSYRLCVRLENLRDSQITNFPTSPATATCSADGLTWGNYFLSSPN